jgi:DNA-binding Xre family transcriptional regulator
MTEPQIIEQDGEPAFVVLPIAEWRRLVEQLQDLEDALDIETVANTPGRRTVPAAVVDRLLDDEHPLKVWREHRGLSRAELAARTDLTPGHIGHLETGRRHGTPDTLRRLAMALDVTVDDLVPVGPATEAPSEQNCTGEAT